MGRRALIAVVTIAVIAASGFVSPTQAPQAAALEQAEWNPAADWVPPKVPVPAGAVDPDAVDASSFEPSVTPTRAEPQSEEQAQAIASIESADAAELKRIADAQHPEYVHAETPKNLVEISDSATRLAPLEGDRTSTSTVATDTFAVPRCENSLDGLWGWCLDDAETLQQIDNARAGVYRLAIRNTGSSSWPAGSSVTYRVATRAGVSRPGTYPSTPISGGVLTSGATRDVQATIAQLPPGEWTIMWDVNVPGVGLLSSKGVGLPTLFVTVLNVPPSVNLLSPAVGDLVTDVHPYLTVEGLDPDNWPGSPLKYTFTVCTNAGMTVNCIGSPATGRSWQIPGAGLSWGQTYYWSVTVSDGQASTPSYPARPASDFTTAPPASDEWRQVGTGLGVSAVDDLVLPYGIFIQKYVDAEVTGAGTPLRIDRIYSSGAAGVEGAFGRGWVSLFDSRLTRSNANSLITVTYPDGRQASFGKDQSGKWVPRSDLGIGDKLTVTSSGTYEVRESSGESLFFDASGQLTKVDFGDSYWTISRQGGEINWLTQYPSGRSLDIRWDNGFRGCATSPDSTRKHISEIIPQNGSIGSWVYQYDCSRLASVTNPEGKTTSFTSDKSTFQGTTAEGRPTMKLVSDSGFSGYNYSAGAKIRTVKAQRPGTTARTFTFYAPDTAHMDEYLGQWNAFGGIVVEYCDFRGAVGSTEYCYRPVTLKFDVNNRLRVEERGPTGNTPYIRRWQFNSVGQLDSYRDANGNAATYLYDDNGNLAASTNFGAGGVVNSASTYRDAFKPTLISALSGPGPGSASMYGYDAAGRLTSRDSGITTGAPSGEHVEYTYSDSSTPAYGADGAVQPNENAPIGLLTSTRSVAGASSLRYRSNGDLVTISEPGHSDVRQTFDVAGRVVSQQFGAISSANTFVRSELGRVTIERYGCQTNAVTGVQSFLQVQRGYDDDGLPTQITNSALNCTSKIPLGADRKYDYKYDAAGRLISVTDPSGGVTSYEYDPLNPDLITRSVDPRGRISTYDYEPVYGKVSQVRQGVTTPAGVVQVVTEANEYDYAGRLLETTDADGRRTIYTYSPNDFVIRADRVVGDTRAILWDVVRDGAGNITCQTIGGTCAEAHPLRRTIFAYDAEQRLESTTVDPGGVNRTTTTLRDTVGRIVGTAVTDGSRTESVRYTVDAAGQPLTSTVENGDVDLVTQLVRDTNENIIRTVDPRGYTSSAPIYYTSSTVFDDRGRPTEFVKPAANVDTPTNTTTFTGLAQEPTSPRVKVGYNAFGDIEDILDELGNHTSMIFDRGGHVIETHLPTYKNPVTGETVEPVTASTFAVSGDQLTSTNERGATTTFEYDITGNLTKQVGPDIDGKHSTYLAYYDAAGLLKTEVSTRGSATSYWYDALGRLLKKGVYILEDSTSIDGQVRLDTSYEYNAAGDVTAVTNPDNVTTRYTYNGAGEVLTATSPGATGVHRFQYDLRGRVTRATDPAGRAVEHTFDLAGREIATTRIGSDGTRLTTSTQFDAAGNAVSVTDPGGITTQRTFDGLDHLTSKTHPLTPTTSTTEQYGYDLAGNLVRTRDGNGRDTWTTYNTWNLPEKTVLPSTPAQSAVGDRTWLNAYSPGGDRTTEKVPGGITIGRTFSPLGQLLTENAVDANNPSQTPTRSFSYSNAGDVTTATADGVTQSFSWGSVGQLLAQNGPEGTLRVAYTDSGHPEAIANPDGTTDRYYVDPYGRPQGAESSRTHTTSAITYDPVTGDRTGTTFTGGVTSDRLDPFGRLAERVTKNTSGATISSLALTYDANDRILTRTGSGAVSDGGSYEYDLAGQLTKWTPQGTSGAATSYTRDLAGNLTAESSAASTTTRQYDQRNRITLITESAPSSSTTKAVSSNAAGAITAVGTGPSARAIQYDAFGQVAQDGMSTYTYDAFGRVASANSTPFTYLGQALLPRSAPTGTGNTTELVTRDASNTQIRALDNGTTARIPLSDQRGNINALVSASTNTPTSTAFTPFGTRLNTSTTGSNFGYQGSWTDPANGLVNMGARWYDPALGSFLSKDPANASAGIPYALNDYAYAAGDPLSKVDVTGNFWAVVGVLGLAAVVAEAAVTAVALVTLGAMLWQAASSISESMSRGGAGMDFIMRSVATGVNTGRNIGAGADALKKWIEAANTQATIKGASLGISLGALIPAAGGAIQRALFDYLNTLPQYSPSKDTLRWPSFAPTNISKISSTSAGRVAAPARGPVANPFRPGIQLNPIAATPAIGATVAASGIEAAACGLGGTLTTCATAVPSSVGCMGMAATARFCMAAIPVPGPRLSWGGTAASVKQGDSAGPTDVAVSIPVLGITVPHVDAQSNVGGGKPPQKNEDEGCEPNTQEQHPSDRGVGGNAPRKLEPEGRSASRNAEQNEEVAEAIRQLTDAGATDIRLNQQQVSRLLKKVGINRPDLQFTFEDMRYNVEFESRGSDRGPVHVQRISANDPCGTSAWVRSPLDVLDMLGL